MLHLYKTRQGLTLRPPVECYALRIYFADPLPTREGLQYGWIISPGVIVGKPGDVFIRPTHQPALESSLAQEVSAPAWCKPWLEKIQKGTHPLKAAAEMGKTIKELVEAIIGVMEP